MDWHRFKGTHIHSYMSANLLHITSSAFLLRKGMWKSTPMNFDICVATKLSFLSPLVIKGFLQVKKDVRNKVLLDSKGDGGTWEGIKRLIH